MAAAIAAVAVQREGAAAGRVLEESPVVGAIRAAVAAARGLDVVGGMGACACVRACLRVCL